MRKLWKKILSLFKRKQETQPRIDTLENGLQIVTPVPERHNVYINAVPPQDRHFGVRNYYDQYTTIERAELEHRLNSIVISCGVTEYPTRFEYDFQRMDAV